MNGVVSTSSGNAMKTEGRCFLETCLEDRLCDEGPVPAMASQAPSKRNVGELNRSRMGEGWTENKAQTGTRWLMVGAVNLLWSQVQIGNTVTKIMLLQVQV